MGLDGKLLRRALDRLEADRRRREAGEGELRQRLYALDPALEELDADLRSTAARAIEQALRTGEDPARAMEELQEKSLGLQRERARRIADLGYPAGCIDGLPACEKCSDRGYVGREPCDCLMKLYREEQNRELSKLLDLRGECFPAFRLDYYDDQPDPNTGTSPRQHMKMVELVCRRYAEGFNGSGGNLFLTGGPGLGKTFLSSCIASAVAEKGWSVVYETAVNLCTRFEEARFGRRGDTEEAERDVERYLHCDLLILDDLGTEMGTAFSVSVIYEVINARLRAKRCTVISSNLDGSQLSSRYSPQIASRLNGEYTALKFYGRDIRRLKNQM